MGEPSIPVAQDPHGNTVPIEEAVRYKKDYYRCPECGEILNPYKGDKITHYYSHKKGVLDETDCDLSSQADVDRMVEELRTSDVEKTEKERRIRLYIGEDHLGRERLFGVIPALEWVDFTEGADIDRMLDRISIETAGVENPPVARNFHPSESEVAFDLDPNKEEFVVNVFNADHLEKIQGRWKADGLSDGDLFLGDQGRARRHRKDRQIQHGEWVYLVTTSPPSKLPDIVEVRSLGAYSILAFPARQSTEQLLEEYGEGLTTDRFGFEADVIIPGRAHPTIEEPIACYPEEEILIGVTPSPEIDPIFEVVSIPKEQDETTEIEPTGPGNPRFFHTEAPSRGSKRISIHQRNSTRHRFIHFHTEPDLLERSVDQEEDQRIGLLIDTGAETTFLSPISQTAEYTFETEFTPVTLPTTVEYIGPEGLSIDVTVKFAADSPHGKIVTRSVDSLDSILSQMNQWALQGAEKAVLDFDGIGDVQLVFPGSENFEVTSS